MKMQKNYVWILSLFLVAFTLALAMVDATEAEFFLIDVSPSQIVAGETLSFNITLKNLGTAQATRVGVSLDPNDTAPIDPVGPTKIQIKEASGGYSSSYFMAVNQAEEVTLNYQVMAKPNASTGTYNVPIVLEWNEMGLVSGSLDQVSRTQTLYAGIIILESPFASLSIKTIEPETFSLGERATITFTLSNNGQEQVENIELSWSTGDATIKPLKDTQDTFISLLEGGSEIKVPFSIIVNQNATPGVHSIDIALNFYDSDGNKKSSSSRSAFNILREPNNEILLTVSPISLNPGEASEINFEIVNPGSSTLQDITILWNTQDNAILPTDRGNMITVSQLEPGEKIGLPVKVVAGVNYGIYPITIEISYYDQFDKLHKNTLIIGAEIGGGTDFQVSLQQISETATSFTIGNIGVNPATSVVVSIPEQEGYVVVGPSESFLGNLESGDFSVASFEIVPRGTLQGGLSVDVSYTGTNGARQTLRNLVNIVSNTGNMSGFGQNAQGFPSGAGGNQRFQRGQGQSPPDNNSGTDYIKISLGALAVIVVLYLLWKLLGRRKK